MKSYNINYLLKNIKNNYDYDSGNELMIMVSEEIKCHKPAKL
jgi:hypothetical protein